MLLVTETASMLVALSSGRLARYLANEWLIAAGFACYAVGFAAVWPVSFLVSSAILVSEL